MSGSKRVGYIRVSTLDQSTDRQLSGLCQLEGVEVAKVFTDKASGKDTHRPQLQAALEYLREGDTLVVHALDRLARNLEDLLGLVRKLTARGVTVEFVSERLTFTGNETEKAGAMSQLMLSMLGAVAQFERSLIRERQREGIALAKVKGVYRGRKPKLDTTQARAIRDRVARGEAKAVLAREYGVSRQTLYHHLK